MPSRVVVGQVLGEPRHRGVHVGAAEFLLGGDLAGGGLQQRRAGEERAGAVAHHDHVVGQARHVGAAGRRRCRAPASAPAGPRPRGARACGIVRAAVDEVLDAVARAGWRPPTRPGGRRAGGSPARSAAHAGTCRVPCAAARRPRCRSRRPPPCRCVPAMQPMPAMQPPPGTDFAGSLHVEQEAGERRQLQERRARRRAAAPRARAAAAGRASRSAARTSPTLACGARFDARAAARSAPSRCARLSAKASPSVAMAEVEGRHGQSSEHARLAARWKPSNGGVGCRAPTISQWRLRIGRRAVDAQAGARDERRGLRQQEHDGRRHLGLGAEAAQRHVAAQAADRAASSRRVVVHAARGDPARRHGVHAHRRPLAAPRSR